MLPIQEFEHRVNALDEAIKTEVSSANPVGCQALNKVLGTRIPTIFLHGDLLAIYLAVPRPEATSLDTKAAFETS
jgi:hypothetical protein